MIERFLRPLYQKLCVTPLLSSRLISQINPMIATLFGLFFGILTLPFIAFGFKWSAVISLLLSGFFDTLDGTLAREQKNSSPSGAVFDIVSDRIVELSVILGLFLYHPSQRAFATLSMLSSILLCITSFLVVGLFTKNKSEKSFYYSPGLIERAEAFAFWIVMILYTNTYFILSYLFTLLVFLTTAIRLYQFHSLMKVNDLSDN